ncbi:uncharacterized protein LOC141620974 [Silene latifolia]|uniref:uncharacterized protein LOC141620974 n=1 Tax=Silene latifolia TaxID=37657 RepID=UPI003D775E19
MSTASTGSNEVPNPFEDPLFLANSDHAGLNFVNTLFNGRNYRHWSKSMILAMSIKNKEQRRFSHREGFLSCKTAKQLWGDVLERYGQMNGPLLFQLKKDLRNVEQDKSSVAEYFNKLKRYWDQIDEIEGFPDCTCGVLAKCTCNLLKKMLERPSTEKVLTFLMGLSDSYDNLKSQILSMEPMPSINKVYSLVQQVESQKKISNLMSATHEMSALFSHKQGAPAFNQGNSSNSPAAHQGGQKKDSKKFKTDKRWCPQCTKSGHTKDTCFVLHPELKAKYLARFSGNANVQGDDDHPLGLSDTQMMDTGSFQAAPSHSNHQASPISQTDLAQAVFQQVMQMLQYQQGGNTGSADCANAAVIFAGNALVTNAITTACKIDNSDWIVDSGASDHMTAHKSYFSSLKLLSKPIIVGLPDGTTKLVRYSGDIQLHPLLILHDVLLIPDFKHNLLSVGKLLSSSHMLIHFYVDHCIIQDPASKGTIAVGQREAGLYKLKLGSQLSHSLQSVHCNNCLNKSCDKLDLYHARLGHTSLAKMQHIKDLSCNGLKTYQCEVCNLAKMHVLPFPRRLEVLLGHQVPLIFFILICGVIIYKTPSLTGAHYFLTVVDDYSRITWTFLLKFKTEFSSIISNFLQQIQTQFGKLVKIIRSDNGTEIFQATCSQLFLARGIYHQRSAPYTPQQNGRVERKHRHLIETARALMLYAGLPKKFWGECLLTATYLINKLPSVVLNWKTPYEVLLGKLPSYDELNVLGCLCYALDPTPHRDKFAAKRIKCIFIGYSYGQKAYKVYDLTTHKVFVSRNVIFSETVFPFKHSTSVHAPQHLGSALHPSSFDDDLVLQPSSPAEESPDATGNTNSPINSPTSETTVSHPDTVSIVPNNTSIPTIPARRSTRFRQVPSHLQDFVCPTIAASTSQSDSYSESFNVFNIDSYPSSYHVSLNAVLSTVEPTTYSQAQADPKWVEAMDKELHALEANGTWEMALLPSGFKPIGSKWIFKVKFNPNGSVERYKARLVAKGYTQVEGKDYKSTFSPVAKFSTVRVHLSVAAARDWPIYQLDINNAFLHGYLDEEIYMHPPAGYHKGYNWSENKNVCKSYGRFLGSDKETTLILKNNRGHLRVQAKAVSKTVAKRTSFLAIAGFIWDNLLSISSNSKTVENDTGLKGSVLQVTLDLRPRVDPPIHKGCIGNLALIAVAQVENQAKMPELVSEINSAVSEMNEYRGEEGVMESWRKVISMSEEYKDRVYRLTSWSRLGFNELDFGYGKPVRMIPTNGKMCEFHKNMIILNDYKGDDGIEAWFMHNTRISNLNLEPFDPEIEHTPFRLRKNKRGAIVAVPEGSEFGDLHSDSEYSEISEQPEPLNMARETRTLRELTLSKS